MVGDAAGEVIQLAGVAVKAGVTKVLRSLLVCVRARLCVCVPASESVHRVRARLGRLSFPLLRRSLERTGEA